VLTGPAALAIPGLAPESEGAPGQEIALSRTAGIPSPDRVRPRSQREVAPKLAFSRLRNCDKFFNPSGG
jgi:hypothetical protein